MSKKTANSHLPSYSSHARGGSAMAYSPAPPPTLWTCVNRRCFTGGQYSVKPGAKHSCGQERSLTDQYWFCYNTGCVGYTNPIEFRVCVKCGKYPIEPAVPKTKQKSLTTIDDDGNVTAIQRNLEPDETIAFIKNLRPYSDQLHTLNLTKCWVRDVGMIALCEELPALTALRQLYLSDCGITAAGAERLAVWLADPNCKLQVLDISLNVIHAHPPPPTTKATPVYTSAAAAARAVAKDAETAAAAAASAAASAATAAGDPSTASTRVVLRESGSARLAEALKYNNSLRQLDARSCGSVSRSTFFPVFCSALAVNSSLVSAILSTGNDYLLADEFALLAFALSQNSCIAELKFVYRAPVEYFCKSTIDHMWANRSLISLNLGGPLICDDHDRRIRPYDAVPPLPTTVGDTKSDPETAIAASTGTDQKSGKRANVHTTVAMYNNPPADGGIAPSTPQQKRELEKWLQNPPLVVYGRGKRVVRSTVQKWVWRIDPGTAYPTPELVPFKHETVGEGHRPFDVLNQTALQRLHHPFAGIIRRNFMLQVKEGFNTMYNAKDMPTVVIELVCEYFGLPDLFSHDKKKAAAALTKIHKNPKKLFDQISSAEAPKPVPPVATAAPATPTPIASSSSGGKDSKSAPATKPAAAGGAAPASGPGSVFDEKLYGKIPTAKHPSTAVKTASTGPPPRPVHPPAPPPPPQPPQFDNANARKLRRWKANQKREAAEAAAKIAAAAAAAAAAATAASLAYAASLKAPDAPPLSSPAPVSDSKGSAAAGATAAAQLPSAPGGPTADATDDPALSKGAKPVSGAVKIGDSVVVVKGLDFE